MGGDVDLGFSLLISNVNCGVFCRRSPVYLVLHRAGSVDGAGVTWSDEWTGKASLEPYRGEKRDFDVRSSDHRNMSTSHR